MKKRLKSIAIFVSLILLFQTIMPITNVFAATKTIRISDNNLYQALKENLGNKATYEDDYNRIQISEENLRNITSLDLHGKNITRTYGIGEFYNLEKLDLSNNNINEIGSIILLKNLKELNLEENNISNPNDLGVLKQLKVLNLNSNFVLDKINNFSYLTELEKLYIGGNRLTSLEPLANLQKLNVLNASKNAISRIPDNIQNIKDLDLSYNLISVGTIIGYDKGIPSIYLSNGENNLELVNCKLENDTVIFDDNVKNASITVKSGVAKGTRIDYSINQKTIIQFKDRAIYQKVIENLEEMDGLTFEKIDAQLRISMSKVDGEKVLSLDLSNINDGHGKDLSGLEYFPNLQVLNLENSILQNNIHNLEKLHNLTYLNISNNGFSDLEKIKYLDKLQYLDLSNNDIPSFELDNLINLKSLLTLNLSGNLIDDISDLQYLDKLKVLVLNNNKITNIDPIKDMNFSYFSMRQNSIECNLNIIAGGFDCVDLTHELKFFEDLKKSGSLIYTDKEIELMNCTIDEDYKATLIDASKDASIKVKGGNADGTIIKIISIGDSIPLEIRNVEYLNNSNNTACTVTIKANKKIKNVLSWDRVDDTTISKTFNYNIKQQIVEIEDFGGNKKENVLINIEGVQNEQIPDLTINYSTLNLTNQDVTVTLSSSVDLHSGYHGWVAGEDSKSIKQTFSENTNHTGTTVSVLTEDMFNRQMQPINLYIEIPNIDKKAPDCWVEYSTQEQTYDSVYVQIWSDEELRLPEGWNICGNRSGGTDPTTYYIGKYYFDNTQETVDVYDLAGNKTSVSISVQNIDKTISDLKKQYSTVIPTNEDVELNINATETISEKDIIKVGLVDTTEINPLFKLAANDENISLGTSSIKKTYSKNSDDILLITDRAGNVEVIPVNVQNIDKEAPDCRVEYSNTTNSEIMATIIANEKIENVPGWVLSEDGMKLTRTFNHTRTDEVEVKDLAGNTTKVELRIGEKADDSSYNKKDDTTSDDIIPQAGKYTIMVIFIVLACGAAVIGKKKMRY